MRSFQAMFLIIFILFYTLISLGAVRNIIQLVIPKHKKILRGIILIFGLILIPAFFFLYIWPGDIRESKMYSLYYIFNGILILDFISKIPLSLFYLFSLLFSKGQQRNVVNWMGVVLSLCIASTIAYGSVFGKNELATKRIDLKFKNLPKAFDNYKIVHFSDIHLGSFIGSKQLLNKVQEQTEKINPDIIFFTGDLVNNFSYELLGYETVFSKITKNGNSYSILGNHDYGNYSRWNSETEKDKNFLALTDAHQNFGFDLLRNENRVIHAGSDSIFILGVENWGHPPFPQYAELDSALQNVPNNAFKILLTHDPAHWESQIAGKENIELSLSGHTHGLQFGAITAGIPFSLSYFVRQNWSGLYQTDENLLYVNTGLGTVGIPLRIDMPPELTVITLKRIEIDGD